MKRTWYAVAAFPLLFGGCYTYRGVTLDTPPIGSDVRLRLAPDEADRVGRILGREDRSVEGVLVGRVGTDTVQLRVGTSTPRDAAAFGPTHQLLGIPRAAIQDVDIRRLDRGRTLGVVAIALAATSYAVVSAFNAQREPIQGPSRGGTNATRLPVLAPVLRLPVRIGF
jgi:hypothetical protein